MPKWNALLILKIIKAHPSPVVFLMWMQEVSLNWETNAEITAQFLHTLVVILVLNALRMLIREKFGKNDDDDEDEKTIKDLKTRAKSSKK